MPKKPSNQRLPEWKEVLSSPARLQKILPGTVLIGGTASAIYAGHRFSSDAGHILTELKAHFDEVLAQLEMVNHIVGYDPTFVISDQVKVRPSTRSSAFGVNETRRP